MCVGLSDLFLGAKKTHPDPKRCFDYYYSTYTHTRIYNRSGDRHLTLLWTFFFFLHGDHYSNLQVGLKQSLEKNFFCFRAGFICKPQEEENTRERGVWCSAAITDFRCVLSLAG